MFNFIKYKILKQPLELKKTHDFCPSHRPRLTVVMLHGIASDSATYRNALKYLEGTKSLEDIRFVTFDWLGSGKSYKNDALNYSYDEQLTALNNSLEKLNITTPLILIGHSMGTFLATRYASTHKKAATRLILVSPPIYTEENLKDPAFAQAIEAFKATVKARKPKAVRTKAFSASMKNIILDKRNYRTLAGLKTPAVMIYGDADQVIAAFNIPGILKENPKYLSAIKTSGRHGVSREKYAKIRELLEEYLNENL